MALTDKQVNNKHERLTDKQAIFVEEYLKCFNATDAAKAAGYRGTRNVLASIGHTNLKIPAIAEVISQRMTEAAMGADEVMMRLAEHARFDIGPYLSTVGDVEINIEKLRIAEKTRVIKKLTQTKRTRKDKDGAETEDVSITVEMYDAQAALQLIGKHHKMFTERSEVLNIDLSKLTDEQLARVAAGEDVMQVVLSGYVATD